MTLAANAVTRTLEVPGATITYDVRENPASTDIPLMLIGSPMGAMGFGQLAEQFADRTVVTYDPRGVDRSVKADPNTESTPEQHAGDIHAVIQAVGGKVDLFASSGGAVNALALVAAYRDDVRTAVPHEPPLASQVPDREAAEAACRAVRETYMQRGFGAGMAHFIATVAYQGEFTPEYASQPGPDPQMFGMPAEDDGTRSDPLLFQNIVSCTHFEPDWQAIKDASTRVVVAAGETSRGTLANRGAHAAASRLGAEPAIFPGGHGGFADSEWEHSDVPAFAAKLREVLG